MTDRPILFRAPMVQALLDGYTTMTRRMAWRLTPKDYICTGVVAHDIAGKKRPYRLASPWRSVQPGDRLWVRESFSIPQQFDRRGVKPMHVPQHHKFWYWADGNPADGDWGKPRPSIHLPRLFSRLTLVVTATKIERLQEISPSDCEAEGVSDYPMPGHSYISALGGRAVVNNFASLWRSLHGADSWDANPEVVALTFAVHKVNIDRMPEVV